MHEVRKEKLIRMAGARCCHIQIRAGRVGEKRKTVEDCNDEAGGQPLLRWRATLSLAWTWEPASLRLAIDEIC